MTRRWYAPSGPLHTLYLIVMVYIFYYWILSLLFSHASIIPSWFSFRVFSILFSVSSLVYLVFMLSITYVRLVLGGELKCKLRFRSFPITYALRIMNEWIVCHMHTYPFIVITHSHAYISCP